MLEVEIKFSVADFGAVEHRLADRGARFGLVRHEEDHYFNAPDRDFLRTDEVLRLRRIGAANFVTYKGPKQERQTKTRPEIEIPLAEGQEAAEDFLQLLTHLKYRPVGVVRKQRHIYHLEVDGFPLEACLDEVEGLGRFAELEILAEEEQLEPARAALLQTAAALGLTTPERRSYLEMLLGSRGEKPS